MKRPSGSLIRIDRGQLDLVANGDPYPHPHRPEIADLALVPQLPNLVGQVFVREQGFDVEVGERLAMTGGPFFWGKTKKQTCQMPSAQLKSGQCLRLIPYRFLRSFSSIDFHYSRPGHEIMAASQEHCGGGIFEIAKPLLS